MQPLHHPKVRPLTHAWRDGAESKEQIKLQCFRVILKKLDIMVVCMLELSLCVVQSARGSGGPLVTQVAMAGSCESLVAGARKLADQPQPTTPKRDTHVPCIQILGL